MSMLQEKATITTTCFLNLVNALPFSKNDKHHSVVSGIPYVIAKDKFSYYQLWSIVPLRELLTMSGEIVNCYDLGREGWKETRGGVGEEQLAPRIY